MAEASMRQGAQVFRLKVVHVALATGARDGLRLKVITLR